MHNLYTVSCRGVEVNIFHKKPCRYPSSARLMVYFFPFKHCTALEISTGPSLTASTSNIITSA